MLAGQRDPTELEAGLDDVDRAILAEVLAHWGPSRRGNRILGDRAPARWTDDDSKRTRVGGVVTFLSPTAGRSSA